jgi:hypothetical protein
MQHSDELHSRISDHYRGFAYDMPTQTTQVATKAFVQPHTSVKQSKWVDAGIFLCLALWCIPWALVTLFVVHWVVTLTRGWS